MPVRSTSRIAFIASRSETRGRWQPNGCDGGSGRSGSICAHTRSGIRQPSSATTRPITPSLVDFSNEVGLRYSGPGPCLPEWALNRRRTTRAGMAKPPPPADHQQRFATPPYRREAGLSPASLPYPTSPSGASRSATAGLHHVHTAHAARHAGTGRLLLGRLGDDGFGREDVLRDRSRVLECRADHHRRIGDSGVDEVLVLVRLDVESVALRGVADPVDDDRAFQARVVGELADRLLQRANDDSCSGALVAFVSVELNRFDGVQERHAASGDDTLLERGASRLERVLDAVLLLLHLRLGRGTDLDHRDTAGELRQPLLQLLAVEVGVGGLDLLLQLLDARLDRLGVAGPVDDRRGVLVDHDTAGLAELRELRVLELETHLLGDHFRAGEDRDVLEHALAAVTEARRLDGDGREGATQLVDHDRRERLALDVFGNDQQRLAGLNHLLEHRQQVLDSADLLVRDQDVRLVEHRLHTLGVGDHVRRQVALVELHALGELELEAEGLALLDVHDAVLADLLDRVGEDVADLAVAGGDGRHAGDVLLAGDLLGLRLQVLHHLLDRPLDPTLDRHRVRPGGDVAETVLDDRLSQDGRSRRAVAGNVVRRCGDLADELRALVLEDVLDLDLTRDRDAVVRNRGRAELLVEHDVAPLRAKGDLDRVGEDVHAPLERAARILVELQLLVSHVVSLPPFVAYAFAPASSRSPTTLASTSASRRIKTSSVPSLISVPPYLLKMISSPSSRSILMYSPSSSRAPGPTASTRPRCGFSFAVSGSTMPLTVVSSSSRTSTISRSPSGCRFIHLLLFRRLCDNHWHSPGWSASAS